MKLAVLFPGQGSQYVGMAQEFIDQNEECKKLMQLADSACDFDLEKICVEGPIEELTRAVYLQPSITVTNLICLEALRQALPDSITPSYYAGHSLGEYSALYAANVLTVEDTIRLVAKRGALMEREGDKNPGGMRAILGLSIEEIDAVISEYSGDGVVTAANHNCPQQVVVSGSINALDDVCKAFEEKGAKAIALNVSVANHSPLVANAVPDFSEFMKNVTFNSPESPVFFNVSAKTETDTDVIRDMMAKQIASKVRWYEIISAMLADGVDTFIEVGPKTVLKGMMRKIVPKGTKVTTLQFDTPDTLAKCIEKLV